MTPCTLLRLGDSRYPAVLDFFDPDHVTFSFLVNPAASGRIAYDHLTRQATWDGAAVPYKFGLPPVDIPWSCLEEQLNKPHGSRFWTYAYHNLYWLHWYLGVIGDGRSIRLFHASGEPWRERTYSMFTIWNDGRATSEDLRFDEKGGSTTAFRAADPDLKNLAGDIRMAVFGSRIVQDGGKTAVSSLAAQFSDLFQLYQFPQHIEFDEDGRPRYGDVLGQAELSEGKAFPITAADRPRLADSLAKGGYAEFDLAPYLDRYGDVSTVEERFLQRPLLNGRSYRKVAPAPPSALKPGDYYITEKLLRLRLYSFPYPHNLIGITASGKVLAMVLLGDKTKGIGSSVQDLADSALALAREAGHPLDSLFLLANSRDVMRRENGVMTDASGPEIYELSSAAIGVTASR